MISDPESDGKRVDAIRDVSLGGPAVAEIEATVLHHNELDSAFEQEARRKQGEDRGEKAQKFVSCSNIEY